jgi:hypothetical protein
MEGQYTEEERSYRDVKHNFQHILSKIYSKVHFIVTTHLLLQ